MANSIGPNSSAKNIRRRSVGAAGAVFAVLVSILVPVAGSAKESAPADKPAVLASADALTIKISANRSDLAAAIAPRKDADSAHAQSHAAAPEAWVEFHPLVDF